MRAEAKKKGRKTYFTGKPCKHGHVAPRYTQTGLCTECSKARSAKQREDKDAWNEYHRTYTGKNIHFLKKYLLDAEEIYFEKRTRQRRAIERATPPWADRDAIRRIYAECVYLNETMHFPLEVDHIIPINNRAVSGLHTAENFQIVSRTLNEQKGNKFNRVKAEKELMEWLKARGL